MLGSMVAPLSPPPVADAGRPELPAYVSNGLIGLKVVDIPLLPGVAMVSGSAGDHPVLGIEASANPPYPLGGDIAIDRVWLAKAPHLAEFVDQAIDFETGELTSRFTFRANDVVARVTVLTLCSRADPTIALQETRVEVDAPCDLTLRAMVEAHQVAGRVSRRNINDPGLNGRRTDGSLRWAAPGDVTEVGYAMWTELAGDGAATREFRDWGRAASLATDYSIRARTGRTYRLRQVVSVVPNELHHDPDHEAARLVARAAASGFEALRRANRDAWRELWQGRVLIDADDDRWQRLADAAFFYLNASVHPSAPASTSIFGLAQWPDYHYYHGLVMWDIETFSLPALTLFQPAAARAILDYRFRTIDAAAANARVNGRRGLQFSWESSPLRGEESMPVPGMAALYEDHGSLDIALAFAAHAHATGDDRFFRERAAPVVFGVADWLVSRVSRSRGRYRIRRVLGIAERSYPIDDDAYTVMVAKLVLREAIRMAARLGIRADPEWGLVEAGLDVAVSPTSGAIRSHTGYRQDEQQGSAPEPLAGLFPQWYPVDAELARRTADFFLRLAPGYIGSPMLSPLYGVWAAWIGLRARSLRLFEQGYAALVAGRFLQTMEHAIGKPPGAVPAGPFAANTGGFLCGLVCGLPGIRVTADEPSSWPVRRVVLPAGWRRIAVDRLWVRGRPARLVAEHGMQRAALTLGRRR
jgi:hypothetical protein